MDYKIVLIAGFCTTLTACDLIGAGVERYQLVNNINPVLSGYGDNALTSAVAETRLLEAFAVRAGVLNTITEGEGNRERLSVSGPLPSNRSDDWYLITMAGINAVDEDCERYIDALFQLQRDLGTIGRQVGLVGTTTQALMTAFTTAAETISATGAIFGLATQGIGNVSENFLFSVEPSSLRRIITSAQQARLDYVVSHEDIYDNRPAAILGIARYFELCLPSTVEMLINDSVSRTEFRVGAEDANGTNGADEIEDADTTNGVGNNPAPALVLNN